MDEKQVRSDSHKVELIARNLRGLTKALMTDLELRIWEIINDEKATSDEWSEVRANTDKVLGN